MISLVVSGLHSPGHARHPVATFMDSSAHFGLDAGDADSAGDSAVAGDAEASGVGV